MLLFPRAVVRKGMQPTNPKLELGYPNSSCIDIHSTILSSDNFLTKFPLSTNQFQKPFNSAAIRITNYKNSTVLEIGGDWLCQSTIKNIVEKCKRDHDRRKKNGD